MVILGLVLVLIAYLVGIPIFYTIGVILLVVGLILILAGAAGHPVGGRAYWW